MISVDLARQQAHDLLASGDPNRSIVVVTTPTRLAILNVALLNYIDLLSRTHMAKETVEMLREFQSDVQKVVTQILQQEFPPS